MAISDSPKVGERHVRRMRLAGDTCRFLLAALASLSVLILLDVILRPALATRCLLELAWFAFLILAFWQFVLRAANERLDSQTLHLPTRLAAGTAAALIASIVLATSIPGAGGQLRRVALPWLRASGASPFEIVVTSGDAVVRRGDPVTLTAYLMPREGAEGLPGQAELLARDGDGDRRFPMIGDAGGTFHLTLPGVKGDFEYRVEAGSTVGEWHTVRVADAVELQSGSTIEVVPPAYTGKMPLKISGFAGFEALQHAAARLTLRFNRAPATASLEWRPDGRAVIEAPDSIPVALAPDGRTGFAAVPLPAGGELRLVLVNETGLRKLRTEFTASVRIRLDAAPRFESVSGIGSSNLSVSPNGRIPIAIAVGDDFGITSAELEYASNQPGSLPVRVSIPLKGKGTPHAEGRILFDVAGKARAGDSIRYRLRVRDNRRLTAPRLAGQETLYPAKGWLVWKLSESAPPLDRQVIFGWRDGIGERLQAVLRETEGAREQAKALRAETADRDGLPLDQAIRLSALRERARQCRSNLEEAARRAALCPELRALAKAIRDISEHPLAEADEALRSAATDRLADRLAALALALSRLRDSAQRIEAALAWNDRLAQNRLDRSRIEALAPEQSALANRIKPDWKLKRGELARRQQELLARFDSIVSESETLKQGVGALRLQQFTRLKARAEALAGEIRRLDAAANATRSRVRQVLLGTLAAAQSEVLRRADERQTSLALPLSLSGLPGPGRADFQHIADLLNNKQRIEALTELERISRTLDKTAEEFERWAQERTDPKLAAGQLAKWQTDLRDRLRSEIRPFLELAKERQLGLRAEQAAIRDSAADLRLPNSLEVRRLHAATMIHLGMADQRLAAGGTGAEEAMKLAADALSRLAEKTPNVSERVARSRSTLDSIRLQQKSLLAAAERTLRPYDLQSPNAASIRSLIGRFVSVQRKQAKLADHVESLDLPGFEARHARVARALRAAADDLRDGLPYDSVASLVAANRELARLRQALDKQPVADESADHLAQKQREAERLFLDAGERATPKQLEPVVAFQMQALEKLDQIAAPEAPALYREARDAVKAAETALASTETHEKIALALRHSAESLERLADRLNDREPERERILRLSENRSQGALAARKLAGKAQFEWKLEVEELIATRVGAGNQGQKRKLIELYARVAKSDPAHQAADQQQLATALASLASRMNQPALARRPAPFPGRPDPPRMFLPSLANAELLRDLARRERELRERARELPAEFARLLQPASEHLLAPLLENQRVLAAAIEGPARTEARLAADLLATGEIREAAQAANRAVLALRKSPGKAQLLQEQEALAAQLANQPDDPSLATAQQADRRRELSRRALEYAEQSEEAAKETSGTAAETLREMGALARQASQRLEDDAERMAKNPTGGMAEQRVEADQLLQQAAQKAGSIGDAEMKPGSIPTPAAVAAIAEGELIHEAERFMRQTMREMRPTGEAGVAQRAAHQAADSLERLAKAIGKR